MANLSSDTLRQNLTNPGREYLFDVLFAAPVGGGDANTMEVRAISTAIPGRSVGTIRVPYKGGPGVPYPGKIGMSQTWSCNFVEGVDRKIFDAMYGWFQAIQDITSGTGSPDSDVRSDILLILRDQEENAWMKIKLVGCYPSNVPDIPLDSSSEREIRVPATFTYAYWELVD